MTCRARVFAMLASHRLSHFERRSPVSPIRQGNTAGHFFSWLFCSNVKIRLRPH
jgi:hypothetical protein